MEIEKSITAKPLQKGKNLLTSGFIENIQDADNDRTYFV